MAFALVAFDVSVSCSHRGMASVVSYVLSRPVLHIFGNSGVSIIPLKTVPENPCNVISLHSKAVKSRNSLNQIVAVHERVHPMVISVSTQMVAEHFFWTNKTHAAIWLFLSGNFSGHRRTH